MSQQSCNQLPAANAKQPIPHLVSVIPAQALPRSGIRRQVAFPAGQTAHLGGPRAGLLRGAPRVRALQAIQDIDGKCRVEKFFEVEMAVRDCDLDKYGVVNNAVYASYIDKGREVMLASLGISTDAIVSSGCALATSELNLKYLAPMRAGDKFVVKIKLVEIKFARGYFEHFIETLPDRTAILKATSCYICLNKDYRPTRAFPEVSTKLLQFFSSDDDKLN